MKPILARFLFIVAPWLFAATSWSSAAHAGTLGYGGRIVNANGQPITGPIDLEVRFFDLPANGVQLGPTLDIDDVVLTQGVFQIDLVLSDANVAAIFGTGAPAYIQVKDKTNERVMPRQKFLAVPYALRVPVDGDTIDFNNAGELGVVGPLDPTMYLKADGSGGTEWVSLTPGTGDMTKAQYDGDNDGKVGVAEDAELLNGDNAAFYRDTDNHMDGTTNRVYSALDKAKLAGIETAADVTDATNVNAAGAVMNGDFGSNGIMRRTGAGTYDVLTDASADWNTAYTDRLKWDGGATDLVAATGRASLGLGDSATLDVGTGAGTVMAGDDARISGAVQGAASSTDNAIARFDGTTGKIVQNSSVIIEDDGDVGIGTGSPGTKLDVSGTIRATDGLTLDLGSGTGAPSLSLVGRNSGAAATFALRPSWDGQYVNLDPAGVSGLMVLGVHPDGSGLVMEGDATRAVVVRRSTGVSGFDLKLGAGGAASGGTNLAGGNLVLESGTATGTGGSSISLATVTPGSTGTGDNAPTTKMTVLGNGNVGIGMTTPDSKLQVRGVPFIGGDSRRLLTLDDPSTPLAAGNGTGINFRGLIDGTSYSTFGFIKGVKANATSGNTDGSLVFGTPNASAVATERMRIDSSGYVGIGTAAPDRLFHVQSSGAAATGYPGSTVGIFQRSSGTGSDAGVNIVSSTLGIAALYLGNSANTDVAEIQYDSNTNKMFFGTNDVDNRMVLDASGNVGIDVTTPGSKLDVKGELRLSGATSGYVGFAPPAAAGSTTYTLPATPPGANGDVLSSTTGGALSWITPGGAGALAGDVTGSAGANTVTKIQNRAVTSSAPGAGAMLNWSSVGSTWQNSATPGIGSVLYWNNTTGNYHATAAPNNGSHLYWHTGLNSWQNTAAPANGSITYWNTALGAWQNTTAPNNGSLAYWNTSLGAWRNTAAPGNGAIAYWNNALGAWQVTAAPADGNSLKWTNATSTWAPASGLTCETPSCSGSACTASCTAGYKTTGFQCFNSGSLLNYACAVVNDAGVTANAAADRVTLRCCR